MWIAYAVAGAIVVLAVRIVLPRRIWRELDDALWYGVKLFAKIAVLILAAIIIASFFGGHG